MKQFFKFFTASCLGTIAALLLLVLIVSVIVGIQSSGQSTVDKKTVLELDFRDAIPEKSNNVVRSDYDFEGKDFMGLREISRVLDHAATDKSISGIVINGANVPVGQSTLFDLTAAVDKFKESGKFVYAYNDYFTQSGYMLASIADSIFLNPNGSIDLVGFGSMIPFFTPMMEKLGLEMDVFYAGKFKSATEPFRNRQMSPENKLQTRQYLGDMMDIYLDQLAENRNIDRSLWDDILNEFKGGSATGCLDNNLVDGLIYHNEFENLLREELALKKNKKIKYMDLDTYGSKITLSNKGSYKSKVAVVYAEGDVGYDSDQTGNIDDKRYLKVFQKIRRNDEIKAVVIRVNSGGGSALTSDIIWNEIEALKADSIPVIASMGDYAASGGYYIACNADSILAAENTLTGSIGVFSMLPNIRKLLQNHVGVLFDTVKTHDYALAYNLIYKSNEKEGAILQKYTDDLYAQFLKRVADGRGMSVEAVDEIAQGRVWSGRKAKEIGLVDEIGGLNDAIAMAARNADITDYKIVEYPTIKENPFKELFKALNADASIAGVGYQPSEKTKQLIRQAQEMERMLEMDKPMARMPYEIIVQ